MFRGIAAARSSRLSRVARGLFLAGVVLGVAAEVHIAQGARRAVQLNFVPEPPSELLEAPERANLPGIESVSFPGERNARIAGWFVPPKNRVTVVLLHGTSADRTSMLPEARLLSAAGFGVLAYDSPGYGKSEGQIHWGEGERAALEGAVDFLSHRAEVDPSRIGALGFSMGGYVLAQTAATDHRIRALVFAATPSSMREQTDWESRRFGVLSRLPANIALGRTGMPLDDEPLHVVAKLAPRPLLFAAGDADTTVPPAMTRELYAVAGEPKSLWFVPGARHGGYSSVAPKEYGARLVDFFTQSLSGASVSLSAHGAH